jgi:hypothetical protein
MVLAALPALTAAFLTIVAFAPALQTFHGADRTWTGHAYQTMYTQIVRYALARERPDLYLAEGLSLADLRELASSSVNNPHEFQALGAVEALGPARLTRVRELLGREASGDAASLAATLQEAEQLVMQSRTSSTASATRWNAN